MFHGVVGWTWSGAFVTVYAVKIAQYKFTYWLTYLLITCYPDLLLLALAGCSSSIFNSFWTVAHVAHVAHFGLLDRKLLSFCLQCALKLSECTGWCTQGRWQIIPDTRSRDCKTAWSVGYRSTSRHQQIALCCWTENYGNQCWQKQECIYFIVNDGADKY